MKVKVYELLLCNGGWDYVQIRCEGEHLTKDGLVNVRNVIEGIEKRQSVINAVLNYDVYMFDGNHQIVYCRPPEPPKREAS